VGIPLGLVPALADFKTADGQPGAAVPLGLRGAHQATNASLAVALAGAFDAWAAARTDALPSGAPCPPPGAADRAAALAKGELPPSYVAGLRATAWHGRAEVVHDTADGTAPGAAPALSFYLDGAHTPESMETCAHWFASEVAGGGEAADGKIGAPTTPRLPPPLSSSSSAAAAADEDVRLLLFNCMHERDPRRLLAPLTDTLRARGAPLAGAVFVPPDSSYASLGPAEDAKINLSWQHSLQAVWADLAGAAAGAAAGRAGAGPGPRLPPLPPLPPASPTKAAAAVAAAAGASPAAQDAAAGAVAPSVRSAIEWLRSASRARPGVRLRVLVTGSLYLVGDVLRHLGKADEGGE
jgi:folylpolyglutamate synthase